jgi:iron(III) transport system permease protein
MAAAGTLLEGCLLKKGDALESIKEDHSVRIPLSMRCRRLLEWGLITILGLIDIVPLVSMTASAFLKNYGLTITSANLSLKNFAFVCTNAGVLSAVRNSLMLAVVTCAACILIGTAMAYMKVRRHSRVMAVAEKCASLTYAIPGIVLSLAMIFHWAEPLPGVHPGIYGTIHILIIAYITRYLILQIKGSTTALLAVNPELEDAVRASGRGPRVLWQKILIPLLVQPVLAGSFLIFVSALTELTLSSMLASAGTKTIGLTIFNFQQAGDYSLSAAMSAIIVILVLGGYGMTRFTSGQKEGETENEPVSRTHRKKVWPGMGTQGH